MRNEFDSDVGWIGNHFAFAGSLIINAAGDSEMRDETQTKEAEKVETKMEEDAAVAIKRNKTKIEGISVSHGGKRQRDTRIW